MEVPSEPSGPRSRSTDFSIDRILSDEPRGDQGSESPSWLCCTRYRPPRLPRVSNSGSRARRTGRHARVPFTAEQAAALEAAYGRAPYLAPPALRALAAALQLRDDRIKIWFQNRRARERREKCTNISPPQAMTLPPTGELSVNRNYLTNITSVDHESGLYNDPVVGRNIQNRLLIEAPDNSRMAITPMCLVQRNIQTSFHDRNTVSTLDDNGEVFIDNNSYDRAESPLDVDTIDD